MHSIPSTLLPLLCLPEQLATCRNTVTASYCVQSDYQEVSEQVEIIKTMLSKSGNDHTRMQAENAALAKELDSKRLRLDDVRKKVANNRRKLEGEYVHLDTLAAKERELDNLANLESKRLEEVRPFNSMFTGSTVAPCAHVCFPGRLRTMNWNCGQALHQLCRLG